jgi:flavin reductase (DIM6/NTAB) family NADH-FMN oxidoreductase RutF
MPDPDQKTEYFRQSMRRLAAAVSIVSCKRNGARFGMTVTSAMALTFSPLSMLVCINKSAAMSDPLKSAGHYCINVLQSDHAAISRAFSGGLLHEKRFNAGVWAEANGVPYLLDAQTSLFCQVDQIIPYGTHDIVIGHVSDVHFVSTISPLIYQNGEYATTALLST